MSKKQKIYFMLKLLRWSLGFIFINIFALAAYVYYPVMFSPADNYLSRKGDLKTINITNKWREHDSDYTELDLLSETGLQAQITVRIPVKAKRRLPVTFLLGGYGTGRDACRIVPNINYVICVSMSYPYYGNKNIEGLGFFSNLRELQQAVIDTPSAMLLALDYVLSQPYSDANQVELLGVSFGSYFVGIPAALDHRVTRVWIAHGAAEPIKVMNHNYNVDPEQRFLNTILTYLVGYAIGSQHVDPKKWIGKVSPRPIIFINAKNDKTFPHSSVVALHQAAGQPKEIIWTTGMHVTPGRKEIVTQISDIILSRIEGDFLKRR